jgi:hypothetical protein
MMYFKNFVAVAVCFILFSSFGWFEPLSGIWQGQQQTLHFTKKNQCRWVMTNGSRSDTFQVAYRYQKTGKLTGTLDLGPFDRGILKGKTLYGLVVWKESKMAFEFDAEPGKKPAVRPKAIRPDQVQLYKKIN